MPSGSINPPINANVVDTATPPIPEARAWLAAYDGRYGPPINLAQAVPGAPPPLEMLARLAAAGASVEACGYGPIFGDADLVAAYARDVEAVYGSPILPSEIAITSGCNEAFFVSILAVAKAGDAVLLPAPWYFNHEMTLRILGIEPIVLPTHAVRGFVPDPAEAAVILRDHRASRPDVPVRAFVLVTPNNPTGAIYPADVVAAFGALALEHGSWLILDETYRDFRCDPRAQPHAVFGIPAVRQRLIQLYSFSKAYAIPGHRVGALIAPGEAMQQIGKVLDCIQICAPRSAQSALAWAVQGTVAWRAATARQIAHRAHLFAEGLVAAPGWQVDAIGAYFAYIRHPFPGRPGREVAQQLACDFGVLALPGDYFGPSQDRHLRFAFANADDASAAKVGERIARFTA
jgi:aspartate/methionine/tyrosine aminotransferase